LFSFLSLYAHHLFDCTSNVELFNIYSELARFDLGIIQKVLHQEAHQVCR